MFHDQFLTIKFRLPFSWLHLAATPSDCKVRTEKNYINIYVYMGRGTKRTNTSPTFTWLLGAFGPRVSAKSFRRLGETLSSFFDSCCQMLKASPSPHKQHTTCPEPYRNLKQVRVSLRLGVEVEVEVRHIDRAMAMAQSAPKSLHTSHISEHLYTAHTHTHRHVHVLMMAFLACSKQSSWNETKTKTKKNQKRKTIKPFYSFHARSPRNEKFYNLNWHLNW